jgi:hypothetical protein
MMRTARPGGVGPSAASDWRRSSAWPSKNASVSGAAGRSSSDSPPSAARAAMTASRLGMTLASQRPSEERPSGINSSESSRRS